jgi:beta-glucosidase
MLNMHQSGRGKLITRILIVALLCVTGATQTFAKPQLPGTPTLRSLPVYGSEGTVAPYSLFLGTPENWGYIVPESGTFDAGTVKVEPTRVGNGNGIKVTWNGGMGQIYSQSTSFINLIEYPIAKGALVFDAIVHKAPASQVTMRVDCGYPCRGTVDMTRIYRDMPLETRQTIKIALACFAKTGTKFTAVNTPWLIFTDGAFSVSLANIRWVPGAGQDQDAAMCGN